MKDKKAISLKTLNKSNVWDIQENDVFRMWEAAEKNPDLKDNMRHYTDIIRTAFEVEEIRVDNPEVLKKYEARGFKTGTVRGEDNTKKQFAVKKRPIQRVNDLTYENIHHISAAKLIEVLSRNFGGGWESLPQSIQDIILSGFDISTNTLPKDRLHKAGGLYEKKVNDGYEVLEIPKGSWVEAIFAKEKPEMSEPLVTAPPEFDGDDESDEKEKSTADEESTEQDGDMEEDTSLDRSIKEEDEDSSDEDDDFDDEKLTEESYRTTIDTNPDDLNYEAEEISDEDSEDQY